MTAATSSDHDRVLIALEHLADAIATLRGIPNTGPHLSRIALTLSDLVILARLACRSPREVEKT